MPVEEEERDEGSSSPAPHRLDALTVAAGLLDAAGGLGGGLSEADATEQFHDLLTPSALWQAGPVGIEQAEELLLAPGRVPRWRAPDEAAFASSAHTVLMAFHAALHSLRRPGWAAPALRLQVPDARAAQRLAGLEPVGPYLIAPIIASRAGQAMRPFAWRWPLRIGIAPGAQGDRWRQALAQSPYAALYDVHTLGPGHAGPLDIAFVDADSPLADPAAACVVVLGAHTTALQNLEQGRQRFRSPIVIGAASADPGWFQHALAEMAHDQPIDVALRIASPASLITGDPGLLRFTAVRQWALAKAYQLRAATGDAVSASSLDPAEVLLRAGLELVFDSEQNGATEVANRSRAIARRGHDTTLRAGSLAARSAPPSAAAAPPTAEPAMAAAPPEPPGAAPQPQPQPAPEPAAPPPARRLIANAHARGRLRGNTLLPDTEHELRVRIAHPSARDTAASQNFPEAQLPADARLTLMVDVSCEALALRARLPISLSTVNRSEPSSIAQFKFRTQGEGSLVDIKILVSHLGRPLQEAHYVATVRKRALPGDIARLDAVPLSSWPEPRAHTTAADVSLEVNGANLLRADTGAAVDLSQVRGILDDIELEASRVLADDAAPESLGEPSALALLISLARAGAMFRQHLEPLQIGAAKTISLLVHASTPVLPMELVYEREAPGLGAALCQHRLGGTMVGQAAICADAGRDVVCPHAFWGQQRVLARTIRLASEPRRRAPSSALSLSPVLYAATVRADAQTLTDPKPSDHLLAQLIDIVGAGHVVRAQTWDDWKTQVRQARPQLLVVLGHTESAGLRETVLEIGSQSWLRDPDIDDEYLHTEGAPLPVVVLLACSSAVPRNHFGGLTAAFAGGGAAVVVATLSKLRGPQGARAAAAVVRALCGNAPARAPNLAGAMTAARQRLLDEGLLVGLLLVAHGDIDLPLVH